MVDRLNGRKMGRAPTGSARRENYTYAPVSYTHLFVPEQMAGRRVFVSFQGAESCIAIWLNGHYVGFSGDSFTPSEFELTDYLIEGENKLACRVERWSAGSWLEDQDFMRMSGLFRDVYLYAIPKAHIADLHLKTLLDDSYTDAVLDLSVQMALDPSVGACSVSFELTAVSYTHLDVYKRQASHRARRPCRHYGRFYPQLCAGQHACHAQREHVGAGQPDVYKRQIISSVPEKKPAITL